MIAEPRARQPLNKQYVETAPSTDTSLPPPQPIQDNPFVRQVASVAGMQEEIVEPGLDSIMFLSARFCKTCKSLNPQFTRLARTYGEINGNIKFVKAEATGTYGKELGRVLETDAVPAFILFKNGKRFGSPLSVSRLPSAKIDRALELLESGGDWDPSILAD